MPDIVIGSGKIVVEQTAQKVAENLSGKHLGSVAGSALKKVNFLLVIFDPFPPPAGGPEDMIRIPIMQSADLQMKNDSPGKR